MAFRISPPSGSAPAAALDADLLRFGSILIYCRSSVVLSLLVYASLAAKLYSDLYVHLIRHATRGLARGDAPAGAFFMALLFGSLFLASRTKPSVERAALLILAANVGVFLLRGESRVNSGSYRMLCVASLALDLGLAATVLAFYRRYPNMMKLLRESDASGAPVRELRFPAR